jgi:hypothetical protein
VTLHSELKSLTVASLYSVQFLHSRKMLSMHLSLLFITTVSALQLTDYPFNRPEITNFISYISSSPYLSEKFTSADNYTILAPTNNALSIWLANNYSADLVNATINYHLLQGIHSLSSLKDGPQLLTSSLIDRSFCNVTGGQRVESRPRDGNVIFESWLKNTSTIASPVSPLPVRLRTGLINVGSPRQRWHCPHY